MTPRPTQARPTTGRATVISPRTLAILAGDPTRLRRLRVAHRADPSLYRDLTAVTAIILSDRANATGGDVEITHEAGSCLTTRQAATLLGTTPDTIRRALRDGRLHGTRRDRRWHIDSHDLTHYQPRAA